MINKFLLISQFYLGNKNNNLSKKSKYLNYKILIQ